MSAPVDPLRDAVMRRAGNRCEYCQLPTQLQVGGFEVDHILSRSRGGQTEMANVALACPHCNARKWAHIDGEDPISGQRVVLFNPRAQRTVGLGGVAEQWLRYREQFNSGHVFADNGG